MPRPILKTPQQTKEQAESLLSATRRPEVRKEKQFDKMKTDRLLRKKRSPEYIKALTNLDAGGHVQNQEKVNKIIDTIRNEFPELELSGVLLGYVSACHLGKPYEVHTLDYNGQIIRHFKAGQPLPNGMEKARSIALRGGYEYRF